MVHTLTHTMNKPLLCRGRLYRLRLTRHERLPFGGMTAHDLAPPRHLYGLGRVRFALAFSPRTRYTYLYRISALLDYTPCKKSLLATSMLTRCRSTRWLISCT